MGIVAGIGEGLAAIGSSLAFGGAEAAGALGFGAETAAAIGTGLEGALAGSAFGSVEAALTGGNIGQGAGLGALTGGAIGGLGGAVGSELGIGASGADALIGAGAGAVGAGLTRTNPFTGALGGAAAGAVAGSFGGGGAPGSTSGGAGAGAAASAAPAEAGVFTGDGTGAGVLSAGNPASTTVTDPSAFFPSGGAGQTASATLNNPVNYSVQGSAAASPSVEGATSGMESLPGDIKPPALPAVGASASSPLGSLENLAGVQGNASSALNDPASAGGLSKIPADSGWSGATGNSITNAVNNPPLSNIGTALGNNANWLLPAAVTGLDVVRGNQAPAGLNQIKAEAGQLGAQGQQLQSYLTSGTLPPGVQTQINQATAAAQAAIRSQYAVRGMQGSSAEAQSLANVQQIAVAQGAQIATNLLQTGVNEANISAQLYGQIMQQSIASDASLGQALAALAGSVARPTNITISGAGTTSG